MDLTSTQRSIILCSDSHFYCVNIGLFVNNILSVQTHNICNIFLTADKQNSLNNTVFILVAKISSKKVCEKFENNSTLEKGFLVCNRNAENLKKKPYKNY